MSHCARQTTYSVIPPAPASRLQGVHLERHGMAYDLLEKLFTEPDLALPWQWIIGAAFVPPKLALVGDRRGYEPLALLILVDHPDLRAKEPLHLIPQPRPPTRPGRRRLRRWEATRLVYAPWLSLYSLFIPDHICHSRTLPAPISARNGDSQGPAPGRNSGTGGAACRERPPRASLPSSWSYPYPFNLVEGDLVRAAVVEAVVRELSWLAICWAISSLPPFRRYSVMPVARKLWQPIFVSMPASRARRPIIR